MPQRRTSDLAHFAYKPTVTNSLVLPGRNKALGNREKCRFGKAIGSFVYIWSFLCQIRPRMKLAAYFSDEVLRLGLRDPGFGLWRIHARIAWN